MGKKISEYVKVFTDEFDTQPYKLLLTVRSGEEDKVHDLLDVHKDDLALHPESWVRFELLCRKIFEYYVEDFYAKDVLKDQIQIKALSADDYVNGLHGEKVEGIVEALNGLAESLGDHNGEKVKKVSDALKTQFEAFETKVRTEITESLKPDGVEAEEGAGGTGKPGDKVPRGEAGEAPVEYQPGGKGYEKFEHTYTHNNQATKWTFGLRCVREDGEEYVLPDEAGQAGQEYHWQLVKDEPIIVVIESYPEAFREKVTTAPDHLELDTSRRAKDDFKQGNDWVEKILTENVWKEQDWFPTPGPSTEKDVPTEYKISVEKFKPNDGPGAGYEWTFALAWVDESEKYFVLPDADASARHHLVATSGQTVVVTLVEDETITKEVKADTWVENVGKEAGEAANKAAIEGFYADGGESKWHPTEPSTDDPAPDTHKIAVPGRVSEGYKWTFAMAYANEDSTVFLKRESKRKKHLVIPKGEKIVVGRDDGKGDPKETITDELYNLADGADENGAAAIARLLEVDEEKWFPADLEVQEKAKADTKKLDDVKAKLTAVQTDFGKQKAFGVAWLKAGVKKRSCTPEELQHITEEWESFVTLHGGVEASPDTVDEMRGVVTDGRKLVDTVVEKGGGGHSNLAKLKQECDQLETALNTAFAG